MDIENNNSPSDTQKSDSSLVIGNEAGTDQTVPPSPAPEDLHAFTFKTYYPMFSKMVSSLTSSELKRLCTYLVGYPLEVKEEQLQFNTDNGSTACAIGIRLIQAQFGLTLKALQDRLEQESKSEETNVESKT